MKVSAPDFSKMRRHQLLLSADVNDGAVAKKGYLWLCVRILLCAGRAEGQKQAVQQRFGIRQCFEQCFATVPPSLCTTPHWQHFRANPGLYLCFLGHSTLSSDTLKSKCKQIPLLFAVSLSHQCQDGSGQQISFLDRQTRLA